jgi:hypothetical protein
MTICVGMNACSVASDVHVHWTRRQVACKMDQSEVEVKQFICVTATVFILDKKWFRDRLMVPKGRTHVTYPGSSGPA